jgi:hypothetical protein
MINAMMKAGVLPAQLAVAAANCAKPVLLFGPEVPTAVFGSVAFMAAVKTSLATMRTNSPGSVFCSHREQLIVRS